MLDGRKTIIQHHVLYMQQTVFPGSSPGFILSHFDVPVFRSQLNHCIEDYNGDITGYQFQKQMVGLLLRTFLRSRHSTPMQRHILPASTTSGNACIPFSDMYTCCSKQFSIYFLQATTATRPLGLEVHGVSSRIDVFQLSLSLYTAMLNRSILKSSFTASKAEHTICRGISFNVSSSRCNISSVSETGNKEALNTFPLISSTCSRFQRFTRRLRK